MFQDAFSWEALVLGFHFNFRAFKCAEFVFWSHKVESDFGGQSKVRDVVHDKMKSLQNVQHTD
jgi:hypothetical protein